jgi:hypothetical protein
MRAHLKCEVDSKLTGICCIEMPAWTVSLFFPNHFYCCVIPYVYITTRVTVELMFAAIGERPELLGWALRRLEDVGTVS